MKRLWKWVAWRWWCFLNGLCPACGERLLLMDVPGEIGLSGCFNGECLKHERNENEIRAETARRLAELNR